MLLRTMSQQRISPQRVYVRPLPAGLWLFIVICLILMSGCTSTGDTFGRGVQVAEYIPPHLPAHSQQGSIFNPYTGLVLFEDIRARRIGDLITVNLVEQMDASKSAKTKAKKESEIDVISPIIGGRPVTIDGVAILETAVDSSTEFAGEGDSSQSNSLSGSITVTVVDVMFNGYLKIQGEKKISINQGSEYIKLRGVVRPSDVAPDNTIPSTLIANAEISYTGDGSVAESNEAGWVSRFFLGKYWPF